MSLFDDASLVLTPNGYKASKLYSIKPTSGAGDMVVSRGTSATRVDSAGLIELMPINVPRLDYPPLGGCPKILVEPARTNVVLRSEQFDNAYWTKTNTTITANSSTSPDGTSTADILVENSTANVVFGVRANPRPSGLTLGTTYSVSFFAKKITRDFCYYDDFNLFQNPIVQVFFNLQTGLVGNTSAGVLNPKMENYGNGWYRCSFQFVASGATPTQIDYRIASATTDNGFTYTGVIGQQAIAIWGAQFEEGSNATSYIPTTTGSVTRNADVISKTGVTNLIGQTEGTLYAEINITTFNSGVFFSINDGTSANRIQMYKFTDNKIYCDRVSATQSATTSISSSALSVGTYKVAFAYESGTSYLYINGAQVGATSAETFTFGSMGKVNIGSRFDDTSTFNDRINLATVFQTRLTPQQCIDLTT